MNLRGRHCTIKRRKVNISRPDSFYALIKILQTVGRIGLLHSEISEIDLNTVIISGAELAAGDTLIVLHRD